MRNRCIVYFIFSLTEIISSSSNLCAQQFFSGCEKRVGASSENITSSFLNREYDLSYCRCNWNLDPAVNFIKGEITFYFIPQNSLDTISLDLADPMNVDSVTYHGLQINYSHSNDEIKLFFPGVINAASMDSVSIYYSGAPVATNGRSFISSTHNNIPVIYTLSEPYGARDWWPCKQDLNDKIDSIDLFITSPIAYRAASNGVLIGEDSTATERTCHWKSNYPIATYLVGIGVTNYSVHLDTTILQNGDTLPLVNYIYPENVNTALPVLNEIKNIIRLFDSLTIPYPFSKEKYGHAEFNVGGGMEHQTMSFIGIYSTGLIAHELAHQWFGDLVTCESFHDIWLNEGFATYFSGLMNEFLFPDEWLPWKVATLSNSVTVPDGSIYCEDTTSLSRIFDATLSYNRGAMLLHMLRWKLGDQKFFQGIKNYLSDASLSYNYVSTSDLQQHLETAGSVNLNQFFNEWYFGTGWPSYRIEWERENDNVAVSVFQSASDASGNFFHIPVPLLLKGESRDTMVVADPLFSGDQFTYHPGFPVEEIIFDPDLWILSSNNTVSERDNSTDKLVVYPNPGKNIFTIHSRRGELIAKSVFVYDETGRLVYSADFSDNLSRQKINLGGISDGNYFMKIITGQGAVVKKIVIAD